MRTPPPIPMPVISDAVRAAHHIEPSVFTFVRGGGKAWSFNVASPSGAYRLKVYAERENIDQRLAAAYHLHHICGITHVVSPLMMRGGGFTFDAGGMRASLFPYIFATSASTSKRLSGTQSADLGQMLAEVHAADLGGLTLPTNGFNTSAADQMQDVLNALPQAASGAHRPRQALASMLLSIQDRLHDEILTMRDAAAQARLKSLPLVICHSNPGSENVLIGDGVYLIDWEDAQFAAKEMDLMYFAEYDPMWRGYAEAGGDTILDEAALRYYRALRNNRIIADFSKRVLYEDASPAQHDHDIAQLRNFLRESGLGGDRI